MKGKVILKRKQTSAKFNVVYPASVELKCFSDKDGRIFAEHPKTKNVFIRVPKKNIEKLEQLVLEIGDVVEWRGAWGTEPPLPAKIETIEICYRGAKEGDEAESVKWDVILNDKKNVVVSFDNGHWGYATTQIKPLPSF